MSSNRNSLRILISFTFVLLSILFFSCQVSKEAVKNSIERSHTFNATFEKTWGALIKVLNDDGYPFKIIEKGSGILQTDNQSLDGENVYTITTTKKQGFGATFLNGAINLKFYVQSKDSITTVKITPYIQANFYVYKVFTNVVELHVLESNGTLESKLYKSIENEVR